MLLNAALFSLSLVFCVQWRKYNESSKSFGPWCYSSPVNDLHDGVTCAEWLTCCLLSHCVGDDRSTDTTGQCHVRAAGEPSLDPASHRDSGASVSATAAIAWPQLTTIPPPFTPSANQRPWNVPTGVRIGPVLWTTWTRWRLAEWRIW